MLTIRNGLPTDGERLKRKVVRFLRKRNDVVNAVAETILEPLSIRGTDVNSYATTYRNYAVDEEVSISFDDRRDLPNCLRQKEGDYSLPRPFYSVVEGVTIVGTYPIVIKDKKILLEAMGKPNMAILNVLYSLLNVGDLANDLVGDARNIRRGVLLYNKWSTGYFHWMLDDLTRLEGFERFGEDDSLRFILGPDPPSWQVESLELAGFDRSQIVRFDEKIHVDELVLPSQRRGEVTPPSSIDWLRNRMEVDSEAVSEEFSDLAYISRSDANRRRMVNEDEIMNELAEYGFERYVLTDLSVEEQVALFSQARVIVSPHGANLTNIVFCNDVSILELYGDHITPAYPVISLILGHEHHFLNGKSIESDIYVDPDAVCKAVERLLADRRSVDGTFDS